MRGTAHSPCMSDDSITPTSTGTFDIRTAGGAQLILELSQDRAHLTRKPGMFRPDGEAEPNRLPGDFTRLPLASTPTFVTGEPGHYAVLADEVCEHHTTARITSIHAL